jgi:class 3 adenylate cyclase
MTTYLQSTVIMKTDISGFTSRVGKSSDAELSELLTEHSNLVSNISNRHSGYVVKGEGDSFWLVFPSVTAAARAAMELQDELRFAQVGKTEAARIAIRITVTLGDVLHQNDDIFGDAVNLAARIEKVTPPDEIYLSQAAWLALNKGEIQTSYVGQFSFHGISEPVSVHKIEHETHTRIMRQQTIVLTDLTGFSAFVSSHSIADVEMVLLFLYAIHNSVSTQFGGTICLVEGDAFTLTFSAPEAAFSATAELCRKWEQFRSEQNVSCLIAAGIHQGDVYAFRSFLFGYDLTFAWMHTRLAGAKAMKQSYALISKSVAAQVTDDDWCERLRQVEVRLSRDAQPITAYELVWDS